MDRKYETISLITTFKVLYDMSINYTKLKMH